MAVVLVAESSARVRSLIRDALAQTPHVAHVVSSATEALASASANPPDWVVIDSELPGMGLDNCVRLLRSAPGGKARRIIVLASTATREQVVAALKAGASDFVIRCPQTPQVILDRIEARRSAGSPRPGAALAIPARPGEPAEAPAPASARPALEAAPDSTVDSPGDHHPPEWKDALSELRHLRPVAGRSAMLERFDSSAELRALSPIVQHVLALTVNPSTTMDQLARVVKQDHAVSIRLLKLANSSIYTRGAPVDSVARAIGRIGMSQIRETVLGMAVIDRFHTLAACPRMRGEWFWEHSIATGLIATRLARATGIQGEMADALFTAGLLHDIGRVIMAEQIGPEYERVIHTADELGLPLEVVEARMLAITHADLTDRVLRLWKLPGELINPIALHHLSIGNARRMAPRMIDSVAVVGLANRLAHAMLLGSSGNDVISPIREHVQALNLGRATLLDILRDVPDEAADMRLTLHARSGGPVIPRVLDELRAAVGRPFWAACIALDGEFDALTIALEAASSPGAEPGAAVVSIHSPREVDELSRRLLEADPDPARRLPAILVSPTATTVLTREAMDGRVVRLLPSPTPTARLIEALRDVLPADRLPDSAPVTLRAA
jgi:putative nucleotidyltransferase with HDIG domain